MSDFLPPNDLSFPSTLVPFGFSSNRTGGHMARSMMLQELEEICRSMPVDSVPSDYQRAIEPENLLGKPTFGSRQKTYRHLVELYGLNPNLPLFRVLRRFATEDSASIPLMGMVCCFCRDPQLRHSFGLIDSLKPGEVLPRVRMEAHLEAGFPGVFSEAMKKSLAQNVNTTWTATGHLDGRSTKRRDLASGHLGARLNHQPTALADLDQKKTAQADYRVKHPVLTAPQKLRIRKLYQSAGHPFMPGDELAAAPGFVSSMQNLAGRAGGDPPAPEKPSSPLLIDLAGLTGDDLLHRIFVEADPLTALVILWTDLAKRIDDRKTDFEMCERLLVFASKAGLAEADAQKAVLEAIRQNRMLLDEPNPIGPVCKTLTEALRKALHAAHALHEQTLQKEVKHLDSQSVWGAISSEKAATLLASAGATSHSKPLTGTDAELLVSLQHRDLAGWQTLTDAISTRCQQALGVAIKEAMPKAKPVRLPSATISNATELDAWLVKVRSAVEETLKDGPAIV